MGYENMATGEPAGGDNWYDGWVDRRSVREGYWGSITANTDWCEPNYERTLYVAELFNTISSIPICTFALFGLTQCWLRGYELKFAVSYFLVFVIGMGSVAFHGTLLRVGQVLDEVPMLWASLSFLYVGGTMDGPRPLFGLLLAAWGCFCTAVYFQQGFDYFVLTYALTVAAVIINSVRTSLRSEIWRVLRPWAFGAGGIYAGGFLVFWLPEVLLCPSGSHVPLRPVGWTRHLQLHAWFHLTSSVGPYWFLVFSTYHRYHVLQRRPEFVWRRPNPMLLLPMNVPVVALDSGKTL
jgi:dihydroceramidase